MARLSNLIAFLGFELISFSTAYGLGDIAFLTQLYRDEWKPKLTGAPLGYLFLVLATYVWIYQ